MIKRPKDPNPIFQMSEPEIVVKGQSPIERQRSEDGTPHTITGVPCDSPKGPTLYLGTEVKKSAKKEVTVEKSLDPAKVLKSYLGIKDDEEEEKGVGSAVAKLGKQALGSVAKLAKPNS